MPENRALRRHLGALLTGEDAHLAWKKVIHGWPENLRGARPAGAPHSAWELLEHMRICQWDIYQFSRNPGHVSPEFPSGYWPASAEPPSASAWVESEKAFERDLKAMEKLVLNPKTELLARIPHGTGQTILREALVLADHNSYHLGQLAQLRKILGAWRD